MDIVWVGSMLLDTLKVDILVFAFRGTRSKLYLRLLIIYKDISNTIKDSSEHTDQLGVNLRWWWSTSYILGGTPVAWGKMINDGSHLVPLFWSSFGRGRRTLRPTK